MSLPVLGVSPGIGVTPLLAREAGAVFAVARGGALAGAGFGAVLGAVFGAVGATSGADRCAPEGDGAATSSTA